MIFKAKENEHRLAREGAAVEGEPVKVHHHFYQINFTLTMMIWFRFIECFLCICIYINSVTIICTDMLDARYPTPRTRTNQVASIDRKAIVDKYINEKKRQFLDDKSGEEVFGEETGDIFKTCSICLEDLKNSRE